MGEALINLVQQFPALLDKQDPKYKDYNYKDAKLKEIAEKPSVYSICKCLVALSLYLFNS